MLCAELWSWLPWGASSFLLLVPHKDLSMQQPCSLNVGVCSGVRGCGQWEEVVRSGHAVRNEEAPAKGAATISQ